MLELIVACNTLQDLNTLQIVRLIVEHPSPPCDCDVFGRLCERLNGSLPVGEEWEELLEKRVKDLREWAIECLEKAKMGCSEGEERKRITVRTIEFGYIHPVKVEEYEV